LLGPLAARAPTKLPHGEITNAVIPSVAANAIAGPHRWVSATISPCLSGTDVPQATQPSLRLGCLRLLHPRQRPAAGEHIHLKAYYYLLQIAHLMLQLLERGSLLRQVAHAEGKTPMALWGSLKNIARRFLEGLRRDVLSWPAAAAPRMQIRLDDSS